MPSNPAMLHVRKIESFDLPELRPYRTMRRQQEQRDMGIFVAEGEKVVRRLLESRFGVVSALLPEKFLPELRRLLENRPEMVEVFVADKALLESLTGFSMYQGLLAIGKIPPQPTLQHLLDSSTQPYLFAVADNLANAENLGALVRNCAAFGVQALLVSENCASPFLRRAVRSSMGTIFQLPILESKNLVRELQALHSRGIRCLAAHPHETARDVSCADFNASCCIVLGSEGHGLTPDVLAACDEALAIPMPPNVDSLNVGSAAAVFFYEAQRQRKMVSPQRFEHAKDFPEQNKPK